MGILRLIEVAVFLFGAALLITQVIIPLFKGTALFPILRKERRELEKELKIAELKAQQAAEYKRQQILIGEGDAERKRLVMNADGALAQKLDAYVKTQQAWAAAVSGYTGNWVPSVVMGDTGKAGTGNGAQTLIDMLNAKTAKDLALDLDVRGSANTAKQ